jgi:MFS family permease
MGRSRTDRSDLRRFGIAVAVFSIASLVVGLMYGENVALYLQNSPTTTNGWLFIGWLVGGPPFALTVGVWIERRRLSKRSRQVWSILLAFWIGLSMFILPARIVGADEQFGTGALVGIPLSFGWLWSMFATGLVAALSGVGVLVVSLTREPKQARELLQSRAARIILERVWLLFLLIALGISLYGGKGEGIFNNGI